MLLKTIVIYVICLKFNFYFLDPKTRQIIQRKYKSVMVSKKYPTLFNICVLCCLLLQFYFFHLIFLRYRQKKQCQISIATSPCGFPVTLSTPMNTKYITQLLFYNSQSSQFCTYLALLCFFIIFAFFVYHVYFNVIKFLKLSLFHSLMRSL